LAVEQGAVSAWVTDRVSAEAAVATDRPCSNTASAGEKSQTRCEVEAGKFYFAFESLSDEVETLLDLSVEIYR
jgi:hypothetical protein